MLTLGPPRKNSSVQWHKKNNSGCSFEMNRSFKKSLVYVRVVCAVETLISLPESTVSYARFFPLSFQSHLSATRTRLSNTNCPSRPKSSQLRRCWSGADTHSRITKVRWFFVLFLSGREYHRLRGARGSFRGLSRLRRRDEAAKPTAGRFLERVVIV